MRCGGVCSRVLPANSSSPASGLYRRVTTLKRVVLPAPLGPISPTICPFSTSRETSSIATMPPKRRVTLRTESSAIERTLNGATAPRTAPRSFYPHEGRKRGDEGMNGITRAISTLAGVAAAGVLLWVAAQVGRQTTGGYWAAYAIVA